MGFVKIINTRGVVAVKFGRKNYKGTQLPELQELAKELNVTLNTVKTMKNKNKKPFAFRIVKKV